MRMGSGDATLGCDLNGSLLVPRSTTTEILGSNDPLTSVGSMAPVSIWPVTPPAIAAMRQRGKSKGSGNSQRHHAKDG